MEFCCHVEVVALVMIVVNDESLRWLVPRYDGLLVTWHLVVRHGFRLYNQGHGGRLPDLRGQSTSFDNTFFATRATHVSRDRLLPLSRNSEMQSYFNMFVAVSFALLGWSNLD